MLLTHMAHEELYEGVVLDICCLCGELSRALALTGANVTLQPIKRCNACITDACRGSKPTTTLQFHSIGFVSSHRDANNSRCFFVNSFAIPNYIK
jgi:hypothetical protein